MLSRPHSYTDSHRLSKGFLAVLPSAVYSSRTIRYTLAFGLNLLALASSTFFQARCKLDSTMTLAVSPDFEVRQVLMGIRALLACFNGKNRCILPSTRGLRIPMRLLGVWLQPPNRFGDQDWLLQRNWKDSLVAAGIDPECIEVVDEYRFWSAIERIKQRAAQQKRARADRHIYMTKKI